MNGKDGMARRVTVRGRSGGAVGLSHQPAVLLCFVSVLCSASLCGLLIPTCGCWMLDTG